MAVQCWPEIFKINYDPFDDNISEENIYIGARESSSTSNLNDQSKIFPLSDPIQVADVNIESENKQLHKDNQLDQNDIESDNTNDKIPKTVIDIAQAKQIRYLNINNAMIGHLNINSIRNKLNELKILSKDLMPTVLTISKTKVDDSFPNIQFLLDDFTRATSVRIEQTMEVAS